MADGASAYRPVGARTMAAAAALMLLGLVWVATGLFVVWPWPAVGWLPVYLVGALSIFSCWRLALRAPLSTAGRRFWRQVALACVFLTLGGISNSHDALGGDRPAQLIGPVSLSWYVAAMLAVQWGLFRLPTWQHSRGEWIRFGLDGCIVLVTSAVFAWHFSLRHYEQWSAATGSIWSLWAVIALGLVCITAFVKVAFGGAGDIDRRALHLLALATTLSAAAGLLSPLLVTRPYLSVTMLAIPAASGFITFAAERQRRAAVVGVVSPRVRRRRYSVLPYAAVAATGGLLLQNALADGTTSLAIVVGVVVLTMLVVARQISALRDNARLLDSLDANLEQLRSVQGQLAHQASHDALTGLPNRTLFQQRLTEALAESGPLCLAMLDLDDFKLVNDRHGHGLGDHLLTVVSHRMRGAVRPVDTVARLGGDEFAVLLPGLDEQWAGARLEELLQALRAPLELAGHDLFVHASIGVTGAGPDDRPDELLRRADVAMYAAKEQGGGRWVRFDPRLDDLAAEDARLAADLHRAVDRGELEVHYQPIVRLPDGEVTGVEALLRWRHPERGYVPPDRFVPLAERNGLIRPVGAWVLAEACRQVAAWRREYGEHGPATVSVNASPRQLQDPDFIAEVAAALRHSGLPPDRLVIEVTETAMFDSPAAVATLRRLRGLGVAVALDDFGTGQSSLSLLLNCPADVLKVDKSFVDRLTGDGPQSSIVAGLIGIADGLGLRAVAEGVETGGQARRLHDLGYRYAQGYHFARPMAPQALAQLFRRADAVA